MTETFHKNSIDGAGSLIVTDMNGSLMASTFAQ